MKTTDHQKRGFALLSVLFIIAAISLMLGMLIQIGGQRAYTAKRLIDQVKSLAYAEAGIDYAYSILSTDFDQQDNPDAFLLVDSIDPVDGGTLIASSDGSFSLMMGQLGEAEISSSAGQSSYGDGSFAITITPFDDKYVVINSVGQSGDASSTAEVLIDDENAGGGSSPDYSNMEGFNYAVLSGGVFDFGGAGSITGSNGVAKLHSNSAIDIRGSADANLEISSTSEISTGNLTIDGTLTAPLLDLHNQTVVTGGTTTQSVPPVEIPDIDLTPYFNWAQQHGEVKSGFSISSSYTPVGGVLWVNGDVTISGNSTVINGSIIATGNIHISGAADIVPSTTAFAMASRDGNIKNTSSGTLNGLVYAKSGNYSQTANGTLIGQLLVNGSIKKGGNSDIITYKRSVPEPPGGSTTPTTAWPVISAWQK